jgi:hypothetical protein
MCESMCVTYTLSVMPVIVLSRPNTLLGISAYGSKRHFGSKQHFTQFTTKNARMSYKCAYIYLTLAIG